MQIPKKEELSKLNNWLKGRYWAGPDEAADLVQAALLASLEREAKGLKPRNIYYLAKEEARRQGFLPAVRQTGSSKGLRRPSRREIEVGVDQVDLERFAAPEQQEDQRIEQLERFLRRFGCCELRQAVSMIRDGHNQAEAAAAVGWSPIQLCRALAEVGRGITGRRPQRYCRREETKEQLGLFAAAGEA